MNDAVEKSSSIELTGRDRLYEFISDSVRRVSGGYIAVLFLGLIVSCGVYLATQGARYGAIWPNQVVYYLILGFHVLYRINKRWANILSPDTLFLLFYTLFHLGYITLFSFNIVPVSDRVFYYEASIPRAMFMVNLGLLGFLFGYEIMGVRSPVFDDWPRIVRPRPLWEIFGILLMVLSIVMHFFGLTMLGWGTIARYGYWAIQAAEQFSGFLTVLILGFSYPLMAVAITIYIIASVFRHGKLFHSKLALISTVFFVVVCILEGERGGVVKFCAPLLLVQHFFVKRVKVRYLFIIFVAALVLFAGLSVARTIVFQPGRMFQEYKYRKKAGEVGWYAPFAEMGGSFMIVDIVAMDVPSSEPYWMGASWRDALTHVVPFLQGFLARRGYAKLAPSQWITRTYFGYGSAGKGFTILAEGYLNFGLPGAFAEVMLVGMLIRWLTIYFSRSPSAMRAVVLLGCLVPGVLATRNHFTALFAPCAQVFVISWFLNKILGNEPQLADYWDDEKL